MAISPSEIIVSHRISCILEGQHGYLKFTYYFTDCVTSIEHFLVLDILI
jgi:hypothetical protein